MKTYLSLFFLFVLFVFFIAFSSKEHIRSEEIFYYLSDNPTYLLK